MEVRLLPPVLLVRTVRILAVVYRSRICNRKGKPIGDGTRLEIGRAMSLEGSTPSPSAGMIKTLRDWSSGTTPGFQPGDRGSNPRSRTLIGRSIEQSVPGRAARHGLPRSDRRVRLPRDALGNRLTGRLPDFESGGGGSNPPSRIDLTPGQLLLVVTPRSERGGRWFDSSPRNWFEFNGSQPAG